MLGAGTSFHIHLGRWPGEGLPAALWEEGPSYLQTRPPSWSLQRLPGAPGGSGAAKMALALGDGRGLHHRPAEAESMGGPAHAPPADLSPTCSEGSAGQPCRGTAQHPAPSTQAGRLLSLTSSRWENFPRMVGNTARGTSAPAKPTLLEPEPKSQMRGTLMASWGPSRPEGETGGRLCRVRPPPATDLPAWPRLRAHR